MKKWLSTTMMIALLAGGSPSVFANEQAEFAAQQKAEYEQRISHLLEKGEFKLALQLQLELLERFYDKEDRTQIDRLGKLLVENDVSGITTLVDGKLLEADAVPFVQEGRTMVPVRAISNALDAEVTWNEAERSVLIQRGEDSITLYADKAEALVNGQQARLDSAPLIREDRLYLPLRFVSEQLDAQVQWQEEGKVVIIDDKNTAPQEPDTPDVADTPPAASEPERSNSYGLSWPGLGQGTAYLFAQNRELLSMLGLTADELQAELRAGNTIADIADDQDVDVDDVIDLLLEQAEERVADQVEDGRLTEDEAEKIRRNLKSDIEDLVERGL